VQSTNKRYYIYFGAAILILALVFGAATTMWDGFGILWAAQKTQDAPTQLVTNPPAALSEIASLSPSQELLSQLYEDVSPSVVSIQVTLSPTESSLQGLPEGFPFQMPFGDQGQGQDSTPDTQLPQAEGSGFIYDMDGHIVTNNHVVENATSIVVYFHNGMWADAEVVAADPQADLAVIKVTPPEGLDWKPVTLAAPDTLLPGYYTVAVGSPFGLDETMTLGVVSALGRSVPTGDTSSGSSYSLPDVIQTDTAINPGNSGGPLLNLNGEVVGVNFAINSTAGSNSGVGFAIPVAVVEKVAPALIENGSYDYSYLGIAGQTITAPVAAQQNLSDNTLGVYVAEVVSGGPAADAGIQVDDVIVGIGGEKVTQFEDLISYLFNKTEPGSEVTLNVLRGDKTMDVPVTIGQRPQEAVETAQQNRDNGKAISISEAIKIAKGAVSDSGLMASVDSANAKRSTVDGKDAWVVTLSGDNKAATVTIDAFSGEVLELDVQ
jgi:S1-C subfamily serine protease